MSASSSARKRKRAAEQTFTTGTVINKPFDGTLYRGVVTTYDAAAGCYKVEYDAGDEEETTCSATSWEQP